MAVRVAVEWRAGKLRGGLAIVFLASGRGSGQSNCRVDWQV